MSAQGNSRTPRINAHKVAESAIQERFNCSRSEAFDVKMAHHKFESASCSISGRNLSQNIEETERFLEARETKLRSKGLFSGLKLGARLHPRTNSLWQSYSLARTAHKAFLNAIELYQFDKVSQVSAERVITELYVIRHEANDLAMKPERALEGRKAFDALRRHEHLAKRLDI